MDFNLSDDQKLIQETAREFSKKEILPFAAEIDRTQKFPRQQLEKCATLGYLGSLIPEKYGGSGLGAFETGLIIEQLGKCCGSTALSLGAHLILCCGHLLHSATELQKQKYLPLLSKMKYLGALAVTEPDAGSDVLSISSTAKHEGDGYILNGTKMFITNGSEADIVIVLAYTNKSLGHKGMSAFIVEKGRSGFSSKKIENKLGFRGSDTSELIFEDCYVPDENLVGGVEGTGFSQVMKTLSLERAVASAMLTGLIEGCLEASLNYANTRTTFGKPIISYGQIQSMLASMALDMEAGRNLWYKACIYYDNNHPDFYIHSSYAKLFCAKSAVRSAENALQIHGGYGYIGEFPVERYYRDAKLGEIGGGTSQIQELIIVRKLGIKNYLY